MRVDLSLLSLTACDTNGGLSGSLEWVILQPVLLKTYRKSLTVSVSELE